MQIPVIAQSVETLLADALPALLRTPDPEAEAEAERIAASQWPRVRLIWEIIRPLLVSSDPTAVRRMRPEIQRQLLSDRLREALHEHEETARELQRLLNEPAEQVERRFLRWKGPTPDPAYFLTLTLQNTRCFGDAQTLDLRDEHGRPARWTVILGENGLGKTTLLQVLVALSPAEDPFGVPGLAPDQTVTRYAGDVTLREWARSIERQGTSAPTLFSAVLAVGASLAENAPFDTASWAVSSDMFGQEDYRKVDGLAVFGNGAARRMGEAALSGTGTRRNRVHTLFFEQGTLLNAEEWLLQADYAAAKRGSDSAEARARDKIRHLLVKVLPEVEDIRMEAGSGGPGARVEFLTPFGWVGLKQMSLGPVHRNFAQPSHRPGRRGREPRTPPT